MNKSVKRRKYTRKTKKNKTKRGGYFFNRNKYVAPSGECDVNNLTSIKGSSALHENYQKCCPKSMFGTKNSSPYCRQLDLNFQAAIKSENEANEYQGFESDEEVNQLKQQTAFVPPPTKPWYKFWGGKTKKNKKRYHKRR